MSIRLRLLLLLLAVTAGCLAFIAMIHVGEAQQIASVTALEQTKAEQVFDGVVAERAERLRMYVDDYSRWDEMAEYVESGDREWERDNIRVGLDSYGLDIAWVYRADFSLRSVTTRTGAPATLAEPLPAAGKSRDIGSPPTSSYFVVRGAELWEVMAAPIVPGADLGRHGPPHGYFFVARSWDARSLAGLSRLASVELSWRPPDPALPSNRKRLSPIEFSRPLLGWDGRLVATLEAVSRPAVLAAMASHSNAARTLSVVVPVIFLLALAFSLRRWVVRPLGTIVTALRHGPQQDLSLISAQPTELGEVARLVEASFSQRQDLEAEVTRRRRTTAELERISAELEARVAARTAELAALNEELSREVGERRRAEVESQRAREAWEATFDAIPDLIVLLDRENRIVRMNRATAEALGGSRILGKRCFEAFHHATEPPECCPFIRSASTLTVQSSEVFIDSLGRDCQVTTAPLLDSRGELTGCVHIAHDITERKTAERALALSEERFRLAIEAADLGLWDLDVESGVAVIDERYAAILGYSAAELPITVESWAASLHPDDRAAATTAFRDYLEGRAASYAVEFRQRTKSGDWKWIYAVGSVQRDAQGRPKRVVGIHLDIAERKRAEGELRDSEHRFRDLADENARLLEQARHEAAIRQQLLDEVNHRVKNNLLFVRRLLDLEAKRRRSRGRVDDGLGDLAGRVDGLIAVHRLLSLSHWSPLPCSELAQQIVQAAIAASPHRGTVELRLEGSGLGLSLPAAQATALAMILSELATNSLKYAFGERGGGTLRLDFSAAGPSDDSARPLVTLRFADDGPGYPLDVLGGEREGVGLHLIRGNLRSPLGGELQLGNAGGAVATISFRRARLSE